MKSGPGPSTIAFGANESTISPPTPSDTTSRLPICAPPPFGGPSTMPGISDSPNPEHGPGVNDTTPVTNRSAGRTAASLVPAEASVAVPGVAGPASPPLSLASGTTAVAPSVKGSDP